jgi:transposase
MDTSWSRENMKFQVLLILSLQNHCEANKWLVTFDEPQPTETVFYRSRITTEVSRRNASKKSSDAICYLEKLESDIWRFSFLSSLKQNRRYSKKSRKPFIPPPPPPFLFNSAAEKSLGKDQFNQLKEVRKHGVKWKRSSDSVDLLIM